MFAAPANAEELGEAGSHVSGLGPVVLVSPLLATRLTALARACAPREVCGVVRVVKRASGYRIAGVMLAYNAARNPVTGFRMRMREALELAGPWLGPPERLCGTFHTHTLRDASPSSRDLVMMRRWAGLHLIVGADGSLRVFISNRRIIEAQVRH